MPAWSPDVANEFITLAAKDGRGPDQIQLQKLVYIAHGWCLALTGNPLTGDRPEAYEFGPTYRRLAEALSAHGLAPITEKIGGMPIIKAPELMRDGSDLDASELDLIRYIYKDYGNFTGPRLSNLTRRGNTPWHQIYDGGRGKFREIPHNLIRAQFVRLARDDGG